MQNKHVTNCFFILLILSTFFCFFIVWSNYYAAYAFNSHRTFGSLCVYFAWLLLYVSLASVYRASSFASTSVSDIFIANFFSLTITDLSLYAVCCISNRNYVDVRRGLICLCCQLVLAGLISLAAKRTLMRRITPKKTAVIYGNADVRDGVDFFIERLLRKYGHLFSVTEILEANCAQAEAAIAGSETVILVNVEFERKKQLVNLCIQSHKEFYYIPEIEEIVLQSCSIKNILDTPLKRFDYRFSNPTYLLVKRAFDLLFALLLTLLLSPLMAVIALIIKLEDGGPVIYCQKRITRNERPFNMYKFRSMKVDAEKYGVQPATKDDPRITRVGRVIRRARLDELPQLINIIKGDMSFVGPRPERIEHVQRYEAELPQFCYRHLVKGGLTGYAQVYGKYNTCPEDKLKLDLLYIMNQSAFLDLKLLLLTTKILFRRESTEGFSEKESQMMNDYTKSFHQ